MRRTVAPTRQKHRPRAPTAGPGAPARAAAILLTLLTAACASGSGTNPGDGPPADTPRLISISAGSQHSCAVTVEGVAYCWGVNADGQLAISAVAQRAPLPEQVLTDLRFTRIVAGPTQTCALGTDARAYCWGTGIWGRLDRPAAMDDAEDLASLAGRWMHHCGLDEDGTVLCWGTGESGQLGTGDHGADAGRATALPVGGLTAERIAAGKSFTCALDGGGAVHCWGAHDAGQLGIGELDDGPCVSSFTEMPFPCAPAPRTVPLDFDAVDVATGFFHGCALSAGGDVRCWGDNDLEQLGTEDTAELCDWADGTATDRPCSRSPVPMDADLPPLADIAAGGLHSCGLTDDGTAYCWGANTFGQLGIGATGTDAPPLPVQTDVRFEFISVGQVHTCGISVDGIGYCWGNNQQDQLGTASEVAPVPEPVLFETSS